VFFDYLNIDSGISAIVAGLIVVAVRELSIKFNLNLPKIRG
jgi:uncharacterized membrane protein YeiH